MVREFAQLPASDTRRYPFAFGHNTHECLYYSRLSPLKIDSCFEFLITSTVDDNLTEFKRD